MTEIMTVTLESPRELRALEVLSKGEQIKRIDSNTYRVRSQSGNGSYLVFRNEKEWDCECPDHKHRQVIYKHIYAVYFSLNLRKDVFSKTKPIIENSIVEGCRYCGSLNVIKIGVRHNTYGSIQRYPCKDCKHKFIHNEGFEKMKATPKAITIALDLYFKGVSQRKIVEHLKMFEGITVTQPCILKWIRKYVTLMNQYLEKIKPQVSDTWRADELYVKIKGDMKYLFALMDDETRFWIAQEIADSKYGHDARTLFRVGVKVAGKKAHDSNN